MHDGYHQGRQLRVLLNLARSAMFMSAGPGGRDIHDEPIGEWEAFVRLARRQGMGLYLDAHRARLSRMGCPPALQEECATHARRVEALRLRHLAILEQIAAAAADAGIRIAPLKGAFQHIAEVPNRLFRKMADLDLLVSAAELDQFVGLVRASGFEHGPSNRRRPEHREIVARWSRAFLGRAAVHRGDDSIDIHWNPTYRVDGHAVGFAVEDALRLAKERPSGNGRLLLPPASFAVAHMLVHCVNIAEHEGPSLSRLLDVALTAKRSHCAFDDLDWAWSSDGRARVSRMLRRYWDAGAAAVAGNIDPFAEITLVRPRSSRGNIFRSRVAFFLEDCSWRERLECVAAFSATCSRWIAPRSKGSA